MTQATETLRNQIDKIWLILKDIFIKFPNHKDREAIEEEFMNRANQVREHLDWMSDRLTEKSIYESKENKE